MNNDKNKKDHTRELLEKSHAVLNFIETLADKNDDGTVASGDVMALLGGTIHLFLKSVNKQLSEERVKDIKAALMIAVMIA